MNGAIVELRNDILTKDCDIVNVLRKARVVASKLELGEFDEWVKHELNGYPNGVSVPEYRQIRGDVQLKDPYHGWSPVCIPDSKLEMVFRHTPIGAPISEISQYSMEDDKNMHIAYPGEMQAFLNKYCNYPGQTQFAMHTTTSVIGDVIEQVKNTLLSWTLDLEKQGIIGENFSFSEEDKSLAKNVTPPDSIKSITCYGDMHMNIINGDVSNSQVAQGNSNTELSYNDIESFVAMCKDRLTSSDEISTENKSAAIELLDNISEQAKQKKSIVVIKSLLKNFGQFALQVCKNTVGVWVQAELLKLFNGSMY